VRLDWSPGAKHQLFFRGNLQGDTLLDILQFPGQLPSHSERDNTKGLGVGETWTITNNLINDFRYGYIRQAFSHSGLDCGAYVITDRTLSSPTAPASASIAPCWCNPASSSSRYDMTSSDRIVFIGLRIVVLALLRQPVWGGRSRDCVTHSEMREDDLIRAQHRIH
jgi:hypothetical protein